MRGDEEKSKLRILVVEDDKYFRKTLVDKLEKYGTVHQADTLESALRLIRSQQFDASFIDLNLSTENENSMDGLEVVRESNIRKILTVVLTSFEGEEIVRKVYALKANHYFYKPQFIKDVDTFIGPALQQLLHDDVETFLRTKFLTRDPTLIRQIRALKDQTLNRDQRFLIRGPTGAGKTLIAQLIHQMAEGSTKGFINMNASEIPSNLIESKLFGHKKGAFTGADSDHVGFFQRAHQGTLFIDEIGTIPNLLQKRLLTVFDDKTFTPLGLEESIKSDFRLITATNENIEDAIQENKFRADFYFRIKGHEIVVPPLSERRCDIPLLLDYFIDRSARKIVISPDARKLLMEYDWFGNVRELENLIRTFTSKKTGIIEVADLPIHIIKNENPFKKSTHTKLYTKTVSNYIAKHGLKAYLNLIISEAIRDAESKHRYKNDAIRHLGVSKGFYVKHRPEDIPERSYDEHYLH